MTRATSKKIDLAVEEKVEETGKKWKKVEVLGNLLNRPQTLTHKAFQPKYLT